MKIEIGESLIYSFLRHEKNCLITQTNWKPSGNWTIPKNIREHAIYEFDRINRHHAFSDIFKSELAQTIKQSEIDVLGINQHNKIYAFEVAFHENGLQYGGKIETRNRVIKKLLRGLITLKCYFPESPHHIAFCSPKVNPATDRHIKDYFEVLINDFQTNNTVFSYYSNESFNAKITQRTLAKTAQEADSSELFARSIKLLGVSSTNRSISASQNVSSPDEVDPTPSEDNKSSRKAITINNTTIPLEKDENETVQGYVKRVMRILLNQNVLSPSEIKRLQDKEYCKEAFYLQFPLLREVSKGYKDPTGRGRYWAKEIFGDKVKLTKKEHYVLPDRLIYPNKPILCTCKGIAFSNGRIYSCANIRDLILRFPELDSEGTSTEVSINYMDKIWKTYQEKTHHCKTCPANWNVAHHLEKVPTD